MTGFNWVINKVDDSVMVTRVSRRTGEQFALFESKQEDNSLVLSILQNSKVGDLIFFSSGKVALVGRSGGCA